MYAPGAPVLTASSFERAPNAMAALEARGGLGGPQAGPDRSPVRMIAIPASAARATTLGAIES